MKKERFDSNWYFYKEGDNDKKKISLPHDAMIHEERSPDSAGGSAGGFFPGGKYIYEKRFDVSESWKDKTILLEFEAVYKNATVYVNDKKAAFWAYGYTNFFVDLGDFIEYGKENTVKVVADNSKLPNTRWYSGSGIYRHVNLYVGNISHIKPYGIKVKTVSYSPARIGIEVLYAGDDIDIECEIMYKGEKVVEGRGDKLTLDIPDAKLWDVDNPNLYECKVKLIKDNNVLDEDSSMFGIRKIEWSTKGLYINGKETLLRGACVHHDNGILGACAYDSAEERKIKILKKAGYNAIRSSHNPASNALLDACDRHGMYVMDESFDQWYIHKNKYDYASDFDEWYLKDTKAMIEKDYNHPSVIMYSIGNEVTEPAKDRGIKLTKEMTEYIHTLDNTRPVTAGINLALIYFASKGKGLYKEDPDEEGLLNKEKKSKDKKKATGSLLFNMIASFVGTGMNYISNLKKADEATSPCLDALDIAGYNYASGRYKKEGKKHPNRIVVGSETFPQDIAKNWKMVKELPYLIGDFMWTGWDYLGEAGIGAWTYEDEAGMTEKDYPWLLAGSGAIDILGNIGAEAVYASTVWGLEDNPNIFVKPVNHPNKRPKKSTWRGTNAIGSWSWENCNGNKAEIEVYSDAKYVELFINSKSRGKKKVKKYRAIFKEKYEPGLLEAVSYDHNGIETGRAKLVSAKGESKITLETEKIKTKDDLIYIDAYITDKNGIIRSNVDRELEISVENAELFAFGSANPKTEDRYDNNKCTTHYGKALAVIKRTSDEKISINVSGKDLEEARIII